MLVVWLGLVGCDLWACGVGGCELVACGLVGLWRVVGCGLVSCGLVGSGLVVMGSYACVCVSQCFI